jgi:hypothetical protein
VASKYQAARSNPLEVEKKLKTRLYTTPPSLHSYPTHSPPSVSHLSYPLLPQSHTYHQSSLTPFPTHSSLTLTPFEPIPPSLAHLSYPLLLHSHTFPTHYSFTLTPFVPIPPSLAHLPYPLLLHSHTFPTHSSFTVTPSLLTPPSLSHLSYPLLPHSYTSHHSSFTLTPFGGEVRGVLELGVQGRYF